MSNITLQEIINKYQNPQQLQFYIREFIDNQPYEQFQTSFIQLSPSSKAYHILRYENFLYILTQLSMLVAQMQYYCNQVTCPQMLATLEWKYICSAHGKEQKECNAISYCNHFLDDGAEFQQDRKQEQIVKCQQIYNELQRRSYRILAHCYHHHQDRFLQFNQERHIYQRFIRYLQVYSPNSIPSLTPPIKIE